MINEKCVKCGSTQVSLSFDDFRGKECLECVCKVCCYEWEIPCLDNQTVEMVNKD